MELKEVDLYIDEKSCLSPVKTPKFKFACDISLRHINVI